MKRFSVVVAISLAAHFFAFSQGANKAHNTVVLNPALSGKLDSVGQYFVSKEVLSGSVSMICHQGRMVYQGAIGKLSIEEDQPMQMNSLFRIASMTKPITTTAVLILVDEGKLSLDDKAEKYLPQFASIKVSNEKGQLEQPKRHVTIRQLLMHTSGTRSRADAWYRENKTLTIEQQIAVILADVYDFTMVEIMGVTGLSEGKVKHALVDARRLLIKIFDVKCAFVSKKGACYQCSELNNIFNPLQQQQEAVQRIKMIRENPAGKEQLYRLRTELVRGIDPLDGVGSDLHAYFLSLMPQYCDEIMSDD